MARRSPLGTTVTAALAALAVLGLSACGGGEPSGESTDAGTHRVMAIGPFTASAALPTPFPEIATGAQAAAKAVNDAGGVAGSRIEVLSCDTKGDPNEATQCAQKAVEEGVVAVVGAFDFKGDYIAVLERAGIPVLAPFTQSVELTSPVAYNVNGGSATLLAGEISQLAGQGGRKLYFVAPESAAEGGALAALWEPVLPHFPGLEVSLITVPPDATDLSAVAAKATSGDGFGIALQAAQLVPFMTAVDPASPGARLIGSDANSVDASVISSLGDRIEGILAPAGYLPATTKGNTAVDAFIAAMDAVDPKAPKNDFAVAGYLGVQLFAKAAAGATEVTPESLRKALDSGTEFDLGLVPPIRFDQPSSAVPGVTRLFNTAVVHTRLQGGQFVPIEARFVDAYTGRPVG
ncbi:ABC transporter substrate-binding protein [Pseudonocardia thermophila]|jgi:ABC-type branched-chain amino acid transport systems, periplasmic component|uniref:ABC transporter substrate-binding protein n=1 Tax=Pseudonocardia thermophila TaxID=1848 RepID=UPI00248E3363|nr:ABC transporter substrate-binding protein [Pseudonocardia thermophila]